MMGTIYRNAAEVIAYVGPGGTDNAYLFRLLNSPNQLPGYRFQNNVDSTRELELTARVLYAASAFSQQPYFTRLWIIQELVLAPRIQFLSDRLTFPWERLIDWVEDVSLPGLFLQSAREPPNSPFANRSVKYGESIIAIAESTSRLIRTFVAVCCC
jgi:Heterokaryon incompatibility protein (HET)